MNFSPIEQITTIIGPPSADATGEAQPGVFAGLLFATSAANAASESDPAADPLSQLADLLAAPLTPNVVPPGHQTNTALTAFLQSAALGTPATGDGTSVQPSPTQGASANALLTALNQFANGGQVLPQSTADSVPASTVGSARPAPPPSAVSVTPIGAAPSAASAHPSGLTLIEAAVGIDVAPSTRDSAPPSAGPEQTRSLVSGIPSAIPPAQQQIGHLVASSPADSRPLDKPTVNGSSAQQGVGGSPAHLQVTVSQAVAQSQAVVPIAPETAAAVLASHEQAQIAAQSGTPQNTQPNTAARPIGPEIAQTTREERKRLQSPQPRASLIVANQASSGPRVAPPRQVQAVQGAGALAPTSAAEPGALAPQGEFAASVPSTSLGPAAFAAPPGELISGTGLHSDGHRGQWRPTAPADQVAVHIKKAIGEGKNQVTVRLEPAELGRIEIKLATSSDGAVRAAIIAELPDTLELLQSDARALDRALQDAGLRTNSDSLSFNLRGEGQNGKFSAQEQNGGPRDTDDQVQPDDPGLGAETAANRSRHDGTLDISV